MMRLSRLILVLAAAAVVSAAAWSWALEVGSPAPDFSGIVGVDDQQHALADYKKAKLVVLVFTCNHCPWAQNWEDSLVAIQDDYGKKGVQVVAVNVNSVKISPGDSLEQMKDRAAGKKLGAWRKNKVPFNFPYLIDPTQKMGHDYGAQFTPHVFVLDKDRKVAYIGAIDDRTSPDGSFQKQYLRDALDALLAGQPPAVTTSTARGCSVKYEKK